jgi:membrane associated rhomboid family serine protease
MTSGADLFVVCKQCGSEVSPYITECPYCGNRLRRRAPKLPRVNGPQTAPTSRARLGSLMGVSRRGAGGSRARVRGSGSAGGAGRWSSTRPYATIALVAVSCAAWIVFHAELKLFGHMAIVGPIGGDWWKPFTSEFASLSGPYTFVAILTLAIFGWLVEDRHGPVVALALFFAAGAAGALAAAAAYPVPLANGANGAALALLACWAAPDIRAARAGEYYEGDLLGAGALAALLLAMPFAAAFSEASWLAGFVGAAIGLLVGLALQRGGETER